MSTFTEKKVPDCHPDKGYRAMGLCHTCYQRQYRAALDPERRDAIRARDREYQRQKDTTEQKKRQRERYATDPEYRERVNRTNRERHWIKSFGLTMADFERMLAEQSGTCAICDQVPRVGGREGWHVDHCHESGKVRGILCAACNLGLGKFRDDPMRLRSAADYLEIQRG